MLVAKKEYNDYSYKEVLEQPVEVRKKKIIVKRKSNAKVKFKIISYTLIILITGIFVLGRYAYIAQYSTQINGYEKEIQRLTKEKESLEVDLFKITQSQWIEKEAREKLGMDFPTNGQTVFINIKESAINNNSQLSKESKLAFLSPIKGVINKVIKVF